MRGPRLAGGVAALAVAAALGGCGDPQEEIDRRSEQVQDRVDGVGRDLQDRVDRLDVPTVPDIDVPTVPDIDVPQVTVP